jgi:hypothetical protein
LHFRPAATRGGVSATRSDLIAFADRLQSALLVFAISVAGQRKFARLELSKRRSQSTSRIPPKRIARSAVIARFRMAFAADAGSRYLSPSETYARFQALLA